MQNEDKVLKKLTLNRESLRVLTTKETSVALPATTGTVLSWLFGECSCSEWCQTQRPCD